MEQNGETEEPTKRRSLVLTQMNFLLLHGALLWLVDDTFDLVDKPFEMLYTITAHVQHNDTIILLPFVFLHNYSQGYERAVGMLYDSFSQR